MIRCATVADVPRIYEIYRPYVDETTISFEFDMPSLQAFTERFNGITAAFPWLVWEEEGRILGYAYASRAFSRQGYDWDADMSIYLDMNERGRGIGAKLYEALEALLKKQGYVTLYALITGENEASCRFHSRCGYVCETVMFNSGYKFGRWLDVHWYVKRLRPFGENMQSPAAFAEDSETVEILRQF